MTFTSAKSGSKVIVSLIAVPLLLLAISLWQGYRLPAAGQLPDEVKALDTRIAELRAMSKERYAWTKSIELADGQRYGLPAAIQRLEAERAGLLAVGPWRWLPGGLAATGALAASLVVLAGLGGLVYIRRMGRQAMASRHALLDAFERGQRLLPILLVVLLAGMACAVICAGAYELLQTFWLKAQRGGGMKNFIIFALALAALAGAAVVMLFRLVKATRQTFMPQPIRIMGHVVTRAAAPVLWAWVERIAQRLNTVAPGYIVVGLNDGFFVTEQRVMLASGEQVPPGRVLYLPLPYLAFLDEQQASAIIGHELAHFLGDDTEYSLRFSPIYAAASHRLAAIDIAPEFGQRWTWFNFAKPAHHLAEFFLSTFYASVQHWSRQRELLADRVGAGVSGHAAAAQALLRSAALAPRIAQALDECWEHGDSVGAGVLARTRELVRSIGLADLQAHLDDCQAHPTDSHPTTRQRLDALAVPLTDELMQRAQEPSESGLLQQLGLEVADDIKAQEPAVPATAGRPAPVQALEAEFKAVADQRRQERVAVLTRLAEKVKATLVIHEGGNFIIVALVLGLLLSFASSLWPGISNEARLGFIAAGAICAWLVVRTVRARRKPLLVLNDVGMRFADLVQPLPWTAIQNISRTVVSKAGAPLIVLTFDLAESAQSIRFSGDPRIRMNKELQLVVSLRGVRGMSQRAFLDCLVDYRHGGLARAELMTLNCWPPVV